VPDPHLGLGEGEAAHHDQQESQEFPHRRRLPSYR
jgi:hypothetical protein